MVMNNIQVENLDLWKLKERLRKEEPSEQLNLEALHAIEVLEANVKRWESLTYEAIAKIKQHATENQRIVAQVQEILKTLHGDSGH